MNIKTGRFGQLTVGDEEKIRIPQGILGFPEYSEFCLIDPGDDTLILWLQSLENPEVAFPVLEPKIYKPDYSVTLSAVDLRELKLVNLKKATVFSILTIPEDVTLMTANLKAPIVVNLENQIAKQIVLQENELGIRQNIFKELRLHLMTIEAQKKGAVQSVAEAQLPGGVGPVRIQSLPPTQNLRGLGPA